MHTHFTCCIHGTTAALSKYIFNLKFRFRVGKDKGARGVVAERRRYMSTKEIKNGVATEMGREVSTGKEGVGV